MTATASGLTPTTGYCVALAGRNAAGVDVGPLVPLPAMPELTVAVLEDRQAKDILAATAPPDRLRLMEAVLQAPELGRG